MIWYQWKYATVYTIHHTFWDVHFNKYQINVYAWIISMLVQEDFWGFPYMKTARGAGVLPRGLRNL